MALDWGEVKRKMYRLNFDRLDVNKSGNLLRKDLDNSKWFMSTYLGADIDTIKVFNEANLDPDEIINFDKYLTVMSVIENKHDEDEKGIFSIFDKDNDGYISEEDLKIYEKDNGREPTDLEIKEMIAVGEISSDLYGLSGCDILNLTFCRLDFHLLLIKIS